MGCTQSTCSDEKLSTHTLQNHQSDDSCMQLDGHATGKSTDLQGDSHCVVHASGSCRAVATPQSNATGIKDDLYVATSDTGIREVDQFKQQHSKQTTHVQACQPHTSTEQHAGVQVKISRCPFAHGSVGVGPFPGYVHGNKPAICKNGCRWGAALDSIV
jgi:hypothetical protein